MLSLDAMLAGKRILAVDDLVEARSALKKMLTILGATEVDVARDGDEATQRILNIDYDIVISDYNLDKGRDGQQILEEARFTDRLKATSAYIILTGENAMDMVMGALEYEPDDYITKPFTIDVVRKRLERVLLIKEELKDINEAQDRHDSNEVVRLCKIALANGSRLKLKILRILGRALLEQKAYEEALKLYDGILAEREINWAMLGRAIALQQLERSDEATTQLLQTIKVHPRYVQCYDTLARIEVKNQNPKAAQQYLEEAVKVSPKAVLRQMELGKLAYHNQDFPVAESAFRSAIRLARYSCYKSVKNYLSFAKSLQYKLSERNNRDSRDGSTEAFKVLDEAKIAYRDNPEYVFEATLIESTTFNNIGKKADALNCANKAEKILAGMQNPAVTHLLGMAETFLNTGQHAKATKLLGEIQQRDDLSRNEERELNRVKSEISEMAIRQYTTELNDKAIYHYERGQLSEAIGYFDDAVAYKEAGMSVLLNAIQAKISYMENRGVDKKQIDDCKKLFERLGVLHESEERYQRWILLKNSYQRLVRLL